MKDPLRVYVLYEREFVDGQLLRRFIERSFDQIGMQREGLRFSVPVHSRATPWGAAQGSLSPEVPRLIDLDRADANLILLIHDPRMSHFESKWRPYIQELNGQIQGRPRDMLIPILIGGVLPSFAAEVQSVRLSDATEVHDDGASTRLMIRLLNAILVRQEQQSSAAAQQGHTVFVSHAKRDGSDIAIRIVELIQRVNQSLGPRCFFDADSLLPGSDYHERFEQSIQNGSLLAIVTSTYHTRPWCRWEVLTAKRFGRPVVAADLTDGRIERTFPYLGNVPTIRIEPNSGGSGAVTDAAVERLTLALLSESLRILLWSRMAAQFTRANDHLCIRPPELSDLGVIAATDRRPSRILYPDPPLSTEETDLLECAFPKLEVRTLSQVIA